MRSTNAKKKKGGGGGGEEEKKKKKIFTRTGSRRGKVEECHQSTGMKELLV